MRGLVREYFSIALLETGGWGPLHDRQCVHTGHWHAHRRPGSVPICSLNRLEEACLRLAPLLLLAAAACYITLRVHLSVLVFLLRRSFSFASSGCGLLPQQRHLLVVLSRYRASVHACRRTLSVSAAGPPNRLPLIGVVALQSGGDT